MSWRKITSSPSKGDWKLVYVRMVLLAYAKSLQSCLTLWDPMDCSLPGSSVLGILQARILEWVAMPSSRGIFLTQELKPHLYHLLQWQAFFFFPHLVPPGVEVASLVAQMVKNLPALWETWVWSLGWKDALKESMATHSSILSWRIPMDRGAWHAIVHRVTKSWTGLRD